MKKFLKLSTPLTILVLAVTVFFTSCKKNFDQPPYQTDPALVANTSIKDLKAKHTVSGAIDVITTDIIISGTVVADDKSGNLYKNIFIQDSTGGLEISLDAANLYGTYPVGRKVFIKCNGLSISDYHNTMLMGMKAIIGGAPSVEAIPASLIGSYVIGGSLNNPVVPKVVTVADLNIPGSQPWLQPYIGTLIQLNGYEFKPADTAKSYADTSYYKNSLDRYISLGCGASTTNDIDVRSSGYANFAGVSTPTGNGTIAAIYAPYNTTKQLILRDTSDVKFNGTRCGALTGTVLLNQDFESQTVNTDVTIAGWVNAAEVGGLLWSAKTFSSNKYAYQSAFGSNLNVLTSWLVTKAVNLTGYTTKTLTFKTNQGYTGTGNVNAAPLKVLISTNYTGTGNPWAATWTDITSQTTLSPGLATGYPSSFTNSGNISLNGYSGTIYIAFRYEGADPTGTASDKTSNWELDDVTVVAN